MTPYDTLARFYDLEYADFTDDLDFWIGLAEESAGPVLELGCGTGRVMIAIARAGHRVAGVDNSAAMLARAEKKLSGHADVARRTKFVHAPMTDFDLGEQFGLAIIPLNAFAHLTSPADQAAALTCIRRHLMPGGKLAMDMPNPGEAYAAEPTGVTLERTYLDETGQGQILQFAETRLDRAAQLAHVTWLYDEVAPGGSVRRTVVPVTFRYIFPAEMSLLLEKAGMRLIHLYGDYERAVFADGAGRLIVVAEI